MTVKSLGVAFANIFDPYIEGTKTCPAGKIIESGADIRNKYAPLSVGSKAANTGVKINGVDVSNYFAAKGTALYWDGTLNPLPPSLIDFGTDAEVNALAEIIFRPDGTISQRKNYPFGETLLGRWDGTKASSSNTEIKFTVENGSLDNNGAPSFSQLNTTRVFNVEAPAGTTKNATVRVDLQQIGVSSTRVTKTINIEAQNSPI